MPFTTESIVQLVGAVALLEPSSVCFMYIYDLVFACQIAGTMNKYMCTLTYIYVFVVCAGAHVRVYAYIMMIYIVRVSVCMYACACVRSYVCFNYVAVVNSQFWF